MSTAKTITELTKVDSLSGATAYEIEQGTSFYADHDQLRTYLTSNGFQRYDQANTSKPAFMVYPSANILNVTGNGTEYTVAWDTEDYDQGNDFSSNTFTAPVTGIYVLKATVRFTNMTAAADSATLTITAGGTDYDTHYTSTDDMPAGMTMETEIQISMTADQTATVKLTVTGEASDVVDMFGGLSNTRFSGRLVS